MIGAKVMHLRINIILLLLGGVSCSLVNPDNLSGRGHTQAYPKASEDADTLFKLQSNQSRTHFFVDGKEMGVARDLKIYINNQTHTVSAQAEGCVGKEEYIHPPYQSIEPLRFTYLLDECSEGTTQSQSTVESSSPGNTNAVPAPTGKAKKSVKKK
jgi:hypothetical protein